jgi:hypothetical protein
VTAWFEVTDPAVSTPPAPIDAYVEFSLHEGVTVVDVPSLQVAVAAYVALPFSFTDDGPVIDSDDSVAGTSTIVTDADAVRVTPPLA